MPKIKEPPLVKDKHGRMVECANVAWCDGREHNEDNGGEHTHPGLLAMLAGDDNVSAQIAGFRETGIEFPSEIHARIRVRIHSTAFVGEGYEMHLTPDDARRISYALERLAAEADLCERIQHRS